MSFFNLLTSNVFSPSVSVKVGYLAHQIKADYDLDISVTKMLRNEEYRLATMHELRSIEDENISVVLDQITKLVVSANTIN